MSFWTYVRGYIKVYCVGRTQPEIEYILKSVLDHMPRITGSEGDVVVHIVKEDGESSSSSYDEYYDCTNNLVNSYGDKSYKNGWLETQSNFYLFLEGSLRDRQFEQTYRETMKFLCRLAKRIDVRDILIKVQGYQQSVIIDDAKPFDEMYENPSWCNDTHEPAWWEHLMWKRYKDSALPLSLLVKYYADEEADTEWEKQLRNK